MGNKFDSDDVREMVYNSLPTYVHTIIATAAYKKDNDTNLDADFCAYFDSLLVISRLVRGNKGKTKPSSNK